MLLSACCHKNAFYGTKNTLQRLIINTNSSWIRFKTSANHRKHKSGNSAVTYEDVQARRREQAECSVLVGHNGMMQQVLGICRQYGHLRAVSMYQRENKDYALVELDSPEAVQALQSHVSHLNGVDHIPVRSRMLMLPRSKRHMKAAASKHSVPIHMSRTLPQKKLLDKLLTRNDISGQILELYDGSKMEEVHIRLRHFSCIFIEDAVRNICQTAKVLPFGSTVNGFGRHDCDVDMLLELQGQAIDSAKQKNGLVYMMKARLEDQRLDGQQCLETISGYLRHFLPQVFHVQRILRARVPIVKFEQASTGLQCDLCINNKSAVYMSELLHLYGELDSRVRPLVFVIRSWARAVQVTTSIPHGQFSNYMVTLMVLFFLQQRAVPILPPIATLRQMAGAPDKKMVDDLDCSFISNWTQVPQTDNRETLENLLLEFFRFYTAHDFSGGAISLFEGEVIERAVSDEASVYIENPLERALNASKNVGAGELQHFQSECRLALEVLERHASDDTRLIKLLNGSRVSRDKLNVAMGDIFEDKADDVEDSEQLSDKSVISQAGAQSESISGPEVTSTGPVHTQSEEISEPGTVSDTGPVHTQSGDISEPESQSQVTGTEPVHKQCEAISEPEPHSQATRAS